MTAVLILFILTLAIFVFAETKTITESIIVNGILALIVGFTIVSYSHTLALFFNISPAIILYALALLGISYLGFNRAALKVSVHALGALKTRTGSWIIALLCLLLFTILFLLFSEKWGAWDAWAIWSRHAKFLTYHDDYIYMFMDDPMYSVPDYPLMLPSFIASIWSSTNSIGPITPLLTAYVTSLSTVLLTCAALVGKGRRKYWLISLIVLCITPMIYKTGSSQYADTLLALFFFGSVCDSQQGQYIE